MEKEFVTYKDALALKKLGFDEESMMVYYGTSRPDKCNKLYIPSGFGKIKNSHLITDGEKGIYWDGQVTAPLYQQAFKWFREKYGLHSWIGIGVHEYCYEIYSFAAQKRLTDVRKQFNGTFEEAELECLKKLIKFAPKK